jgi:hypothetical protein
MSKTGTQAGRLLTPQCAQQRREPKRTTNPHKLPLVRLQPDKTRSAQNEKVIPSWPMRGRKSLLTTPKVLSCWFVSGV